MLSKPAKHTHLCQQPQPGCWHKALYVTRCRFVLAQIGRLEPVQILCIVEHIACLILEGVAGLRRENKTGNVLNKQTKDEQEAMEKIK